MSSTLVSDLFIADLHLSPQRPQVIRAFVRFLREIAQGADRLYILGDFFEAWVGDDDPAEWLQEIKTALRQLSDSGTELLLMHGNRDFVLGKRFCREVGAQLLPDPTLIDLHATPTLLMHGDLLCTDDTDYQRFRRRVRNPLVLWLLRHLPLKKRQQIAAKWRAGSMVHNANKPEAIMDVNGETVDSYMQRYGAQRLIHGHTHRPAIHRHASGTRMVLGDWHHNLWYIEASIDANGEPSLELHERPIPGA